MGVKDLARVINAHLSSHESLRALVRSASIGGKRPILWIDSGALVYYIEARALELSCRTIGDAVIGPRRDDVYAVLMALLVGLRNHNIEPILVDDGYRGDCESNIFKYEEWVRRLEESCDDIETLQLCRFEDVEVKDRKGMAQLEGGSGVIDEVCARLHVKSIRCSQEADPVLAALARRPGSLGVLSYDSDFGVFRGIRYFPLNTLDHAFRRVERAGPLGNGEVEWTFTPPDPWPSACAQDVSEALRVDPRLLPLVAAFAGNDITKSALSDCNYNRYLSDVAEVLTAVQPRPGAPARQGCVPLPEELLRVLEEYAGADCASLALPTNLHQLVTSNPAVLEAITATCRFYAAPDENASAALTDLETYGDDPPPVTAPRPEGEPAEGEDAEAYARRIGAARRKLLQRALAEHGLGGLGVQVAYGVTWEYAWLHSAVAQFSVHFLPVRMWLNGSEMVLRHVSRHCDLPKRVPAVSRELALASWGRVGGEDLFIAIRNACAHDGTEEEPTESRNGSTIPRLPVEDEELWPRTGEDAYADLLRLPARGRARAACLLALHRALVAGAPSAVEVHDRAVEVLRWLDSMDGHGRAGGEASSSPVLALSVMLPLALLASFKLPSSVVSGGLSRFDGTGRLPRRLLHLDVSRHLHLLEQVRESKPLLELPAIGIARYRLTLLAAASVASACVSLSIAHRDPERFTGLVEAISPELRDEALAVGQRLSPLGRALPPWFRPHLDEVISALLWTEARDLLRRALDTLLVPDTLLVDPALEERLFMWMAQAVAEASSKLPRDHTAPDAVAEVLEEAARGVAKHLLGETMSDRVLRPVLEQLERFVQLLGQLAPTHEVFPSASHPTPVPCPTPRTGRDEGAWKRIAEALKVPLPDAGAPSGAAVDSCGWTKVPERDSGAASLVDPDLNALLDAAAAGLADALDSSGGAAADMGDDGERGSEASDQEGESDESGSDSDVDLSMIAGGL